MSATSSSKAGTNLTAPPSRSKPTLVMLGERYAISTGTWSEEVVANYIVDHGRSDWIGVSEIARLAHGRSTTRTKEQVRRRLPSLFRALLRAGYLMATETEGPYRRASAVKICDITSEVDRQAIKQKLERMRLRQELNGNQYETALILLRRGG